LKCALSDALDAFYTSLDRLSLRDMISGNGNMVRLFKLV